MIDQSYPWYINDWLGSATRALMTPEQRGIYRDLLDVCWRDGSLPVDESSLQRIAAVSDKEWRRSWPGVRVKFEERDGRLWNPKVDAKRPSVAHAKASRSTSAEKAARTRWGNADAMRDAMRDACETHSAEQCVTQSGRNAKKCGTPSPSPSPLPSVGKNTTPNASVNSPAPRTTAPPRSVSCLALAVAGDTEPERLAREWIGTFVAAGTALSEADVMRALRGVGETKGFLSHTLDEQRAIVAYTQVKAPTVTAQYLGLPVNLLAKGEWRRRAGPRLLAAPTNSPEGKAEATRRALHERLVRDARERNG